MKVQTKRVFINNLPDGITQTDLEQKFAQYGTVASVEIKERKNVGANQSPQFAYVQLNIESHILQDCIEEFASKKWKGHWINVQEAKESFMERLKREREELKVNGIPKTPEIQTPVRTDTASSGIKKINAINFSNVKKYHSSSSEASSDEEEDSGFASSSNLLGKQGKPAIQNGLLMTNDQEGDGLVIKNNKNKTIKGGLKIESVGNTVIKPIEKEIRKLDAKETEADKKRLQSLAQMKKGYQQQKSLIKNALLNIDSKPKNKITFDDDDADINAVPTKKRRYEEGESSKAQQKSRDTRNRLTLFEEENEGDQEEAEYNFEVKEHFEGKKGQKLMKLQSKFKNDKRFTMDARFLEDHSEEEYEGEQIQENDNPDVEISPEDEKEKQFEILEQVLGKKVTRRPTDKDTDSKRPKMMLRFDPSQPEHSKYEVKEPPKQEKSKRKRKDSEKVVETETVEEAPKPEVSKDTFYKVTVDLKNTLQEKEGFSLANMFSKEIQEEEQEEKEDEQTDEKSSLNKQKKIFSHETNPFRYDSSSDEEDANHDETNENLETTGKNTTQQQLQKARPARLWTESFFFKDDDYRLQEGLDFIKRLEVDDQGDFLKLRRNLKEIMRAKVRNNQRNNRPFKRKLGGKKRIRVKRAMKR